MVSATEQQHLADYTRDIFGNPFRPVAVDPAWLTSTAVGVARGIYDDRAFDRLPILADALQDAGCENADILDNLYEVPRSITSYFPNALTKSAARNAVMRMEQRNNVLADCPLWLFSPIRKSITESHSSVDKDTF